MAFFRPFLFLCIASWAHAAATPLNPSVQIRNAPEHSVQDTYLAIRRGLAAANLGKRESFKSDQPILLEKSWSGATLMSMGVSKDIPQNNENASLDVHAGLEVTCTTCYVKGQATAELTIDGNSDLINSTIDSVDKDFQNFTDTFEQYMDKYADNVTTKIMDDGLDWSDFAFPTFDIAFDLNVPQVPDTNLHIQFDDLELYLEMNAVLDTGATYEINLFATQSPVGFKVPNLQVGAVVAVDLILVVEGAIDISSGIHIKLDQVAMDLALFGNNVSNIDFNGGQFEFLPVTLESASVAVSAYLRIGAHVGIELMTPEISPFSFALGNTTVGPPTVEAGIEVAVFANVAEFITNVTYLPNDKECELRVIQEYNMAVGALAGASAVVEFLHETMSYGPVIGTSIAIFTTTLAEACAIKATATASPASITPAPEKRNDLTEAVISTELTSTGVTCLVTGVVNCPNSEQSTYKTKFSSTITTSLPSGVVATWPITTSSTVQSTIAFGSQVKSIKAISGSPTPYVAPPAEDENNGGHTFDGRKGGVSHKVIIGVCVGLVLPILAAIIGTAVFLWRRKRYGKVDGSAVPMVAEPYTPHNDYEDEFHEMKTARDHVVELRR